MLRGLLKEQLLLIMVTRGGFKGWSGGSHPPYFLQSLVFCNHFVEAETVLFKVELIINNAPLTFIYSNTIQTCLNPIICYLVDSDYFLLIQGELSG